MQDPEYSRSVMQLIKDSYLQKQDQIRKEVPEEILRKRGKSGFAKLETGQELDPETSMAVLLYENTDAEIDSLAQPQPGQQGVYNLAERQRIHEAINKYYSLDRQVTGRRTSPGMLADDAAKVMQLMVSFKNSNDTQKRQFYREILKGNIAIGYDTAGELNYRIAINKVVQETAYKFVTAKDAIRAQLGETSQEREQEMIQRILNEDYRDNQHTYIDRKGLPSNRRLLR